jgi:hypothetical protein
MQPIGQRMWAIAAGWIPDGSNGPEPAMTSHEAACLLNCGHEDANVNDLNDPEPIPRATDYASVIRSDVPIVVQHTRLDSRQAASALLSTIAFAAG